MGTRKLADICECLLSNGAEPTLPVAIIQSAFCPEQRLEVGTLSAIAQHTAGMKLSPAIIVIGDVAKHAA
jgi:siroheme synthase